MSDIISILHAGENTTIEFKQSFDKEAIETVVAFANTRGGVVLIGVADDGKILGTTITKESIQNYINQIKVGTQPSLIVDIAVMNIEQKTILIITVDEFPIKPVSYKGRYFKRIGNSNHQLSLTEVSHMHLQSLQLSWDAYPDSKASLDDLDEMKMQKFFAKVNESGRFKLAGSIVDNLQKLNLLQNSTPTHAAKLLFGCEQTVHNIHIGRFKTPSMILDDKMVRNTLFEAVEETMMYLLFHIKVAFEFTGEIERTEIFEYPKAALRELILNAIVHRDYASPIDIQIKIFDQSITIFNPGTLYGNLTIEQLKTDSYQSHTRNKLIAEAFYLTNDIEKYGSGYIRVREEIKKYPTMKFEYEESGSGYLVSLSYLEQKTTQKTTQKSTQKSTRKSTREQIIELITTNPKITRDELAEEINVSSDAIKQHISKLKSEGLLERIGGRKDGFWVIKLEIANMKEEI